MRARRSGLSTPSILVQGRVVQGPDPKPYNAAAHRNLTFAAQRLERRMTSAIEEPGELEKHG